MRGAGSEFASLESCPALVLNADFQPLSYFPLSLWGWQETIKAIFLDRVMVVDRYDRWVRSPGFSMQLPSVVALKDYVTYDRRPPFTRFNVFLRDRFRCQYCGASERSSDLTFDHVVPRSRGGGASWTNIVTACSSCNLAKGDKLVEECGMKPMRPPKAPTAHELRVAGREFPPNYLHQSWRDFLYWDSELEY